VSLGITRFEMTEGLNNSPTFIAALADLVLEALGRRRTKRATEPFPAAGKRADDTLGDGIAASPS
jgi:hypothetical protein